jgi:OmpA-OmpF porin, OOP family
MKRMLWTACLLLATLAVAPAAHAGKFYLGASRGQSTIEVPGFDESDTGYKVYAGWRFMKFFAVEADVINFGTPSRKRSGTEIEVELEGWDVDALGILPLGKWLDVFAKAGYLRWDSTVSVTGEKDQKDSGIDFTWGVGVGVNLGKWITIRGEWESFEVKDTDGVTLVSAGVQINF